MIFNKCMGDFSGFLFPPFSLDFGQTAAKMEQWEPRDGNQGWLEVSCPREGWMRLGGFGDRELLQMQEVVTDGITLPKACGSGSNKPWMLLTSM